MSGKKLIDARILSPRVLLALLLGFFSGLPFQMTRGMMQGWLLEAGLRVDAITALSFVSLPYAVKFLWAPLFDLVPVGQLGRRRGWLFLSQLGLALTLIAVSLLNPEHSLVAVVLTMILVSFFGASQDIGIDGYRVELLTEEERGLGAAAATLGYRLGMIVTGAGALMLADHLPWSTIYQCAAGFVACAAAVSYFLPNLEGGDEREASDTRGVALRRTVEPFMDFLRRPAAVEVLCFILLYKVGDVMASTITLPFLKSVGFSYSQIGTATKAVGVIASILGGFVGGWGLPRLGLKRAIIIFGALQSVSTLGYVFLVGGGSYSTLLGVMFFESFTAGLGSTALVAFLMGLCDRRFPASQYALLSGVTAVAGSLGGMPAGALALHLQWQIFFVALTALALPALVLALLRFDRWSPQ